MSDYRTLCITLLTGALLGGCEDPEALTERDGPYSACPTWRCGFNSAEINGRSVGELNLDGLPNADGMRILTVVPPALLLLGGYTQLDYDGDELVLKNPLGQTKRGAALNGTIITVIGPGLLGVLQTTAITILGYEQVPSWADDAAPIGAHAFVYVGLDGILKKNVCTGTLVDQLAKAATVIGGETYDLDDKTVEPGQKRWITIACAGSAAAKLKLLGYGPHGAVDGAPASVDQRQATLKMIAADYCGDGTSYTANGTPIDWENAPGTVAPANPSAGAGPLEAIWTASGALCLEATRLADADVACALPSCDDLDLGDGEWLTRLVDG